MKQMKTDSCDRRRRCGRRRVSSRPPRRFAARDATATGSSSSPFSKAPVRGSASPPASSRRRKLERLKVAGGVFLETVTPDSPAARGRPASPGRDRRVRRRAGSEPAPVHPPCSRDAAEPPGQGGSDARRKTAPSSPSRPLPAAMLGSASTWIGCAVRSKTSARASPFEFPDAAARSRLGVTVQELTPELAAYFGAADGVLVSSVVADSPASRSGIKAGDVITTVDGRSIASAGDLVRELRTASTDGEVTLGIVRDKKATTVSAKVETPAERRPARQARPIRTPV